MAYHFAFTRLLVRDFPARFRFYRDVMGFTPAFGDENDVYADFKTGDVTISLFKRDLMAAAVGTSDLPETATTQDTILLAFAVENVDTAAEELRAKGVTLITEPQDRADWMIRTAHFRDPDGNLIEIFTQLEH